MKLFSVKNIIILIILFLCVFSFIRSSINFYDQDEYTHAVNMKSNIEDVFFSPWQRGGFKLFYSIFGNIELKTLRFINLILLIVSCFVLYQIKDEKLALIFALVPFVSVFGCRFYSEVLVVFLFILSMYFVDRVLKNNKNIDVILFALIVSYLPLVRSETILLFAPSAMILVWKKQFKYSALLTVFPVLFYLSSIIYFHSFTKLFEIWFGFTTGIGQSKSFQWNMKGDLLYYSSKMIIVGGLLFLLSFNKWFKSLFQKRNLNYYIAFSGLLMLGFYSLSYWKVTGFSSNVGNIRHVYILVPIVAYFAYEQLKDFKYKEQIVLFVLLFITYFSTTNFQKEPELLMIDKSLSSIPKFSKIYVQHTYFNYCFNLPIKSSRVERINDCLNANTGDIVIYDSHYAARKIKHDIFLKTDWNCLYQDNDNRFALLILQRK